MPAPLPRRTWWLRTFAVLVFLAALAFGPLTESTVDDKLFATTLLFATLLFALFLSGRLAFALLLAALLFGAIEVAGTLKFTYLTTPLLAPDLVYFLNRDTLTVISRYPLLLTVSIAAAVVIPVLLILAFVWGRRSFLSARPRPVRIVVRALGTLASAVVLLVCVSPNGPFAAVFDKPMWITVNDRSFLTDFFTSFHDTVVNEPEIPIDVDRTIDWRMQRPLEAPQKKPDVVAILEESTFDPRILKACTIPECRRRMFLPDAHTRAHGLLRVHTFGGGTWTSEFAVHTGLADVLFGKAGLYAPYNLAPRISDTLEKDFKAAGYRIIAIYPMSGDFLNARNAYDYYGFDAFYDGSDYGLGWHSTDADLLRVFERIYGEEKQAHPDTPLFVFMLTLHQHGPHMTPLRELPPPYDKPLFAGKLARDKALDDWLNLNLGNYLERLQQSDAMLTELEKFLFSGERPALLMHFGDHQPSFDGAIHALKKEVPKSAGPNSNTITYYTIKTNYPVRRKFAYPVLDIVFLGSLVLDIAGVPKNAFYQANTLLRERCEGRYLDCKQIGLVNSYHDYVFNRVHDLKP